MAEGHVLRGAVGPKGIELPGSYQAHLPPFHCSISGSNDILKAEPQYRMHDCHFDDSSTTTAAVSSIAAGCNALSRLRMQTIRIGQVQQIALQIIREKA